MEGERQEEKLMKTSEAILNIFFSKLKMGSSQVNRKISTPMTDFKCNFNPERHFVQLVRLPLSSSFDTIQSNDHLYETL